MPQSSFGEAFAPVAQRRCEDSPPARRDHRQRAFGVCEYGIATPLAHFTHSVKLTGSEKFNANQSSWPINGASASVVFDATPTRLGYGV
jgi:hypothetical protein